MRGTSIEILLKSWEEGVQDFNSGRFWHAHERWEVGWKNLEPVEKEHVQALIQICGMFYLFIEKSRMRPAFSLARSALDKLEKSQKNLESLNRIPRLEILGAQPVLKELLEKGRKNESLTLEEIRSFAQKLKAQIILT